jgi:hypothetical protein
VAPTDAAKEDWNGLRIPRGLAIVFVIGAWHQQLRH